MSTLPPGWGEAVRLDEDPATIPDPALVEVPDDLRREIERHMAKYPDRHSAALPALAAAQRVHGWCSPEAMTQVAAVMQVTAFGRRSLKMRSIPSQSGQQWLNISRL